MIRAFKKKSENPLTRYYKAKGGTIQIPPLTMPYSPSPSGSPVRLAPKSNIISKSFEDYVNNINTREAFLANYVNNSTKMSANIKKNPQR